MVKYSMGQFLELVDVVFCHFDKFKDLNPYDFDILLNAPTKSRTMSFRLEKAQIRREK